MAFLSFKGITHAYLLKISIAHHKNGFLYEIGLLTAYRQDQHPKYYL